MRTRADYDPLVLQSFGPLFQSGHEDDLASRLGGGVDNLNTLCYLYGSPR